MENSKSGFLHTGGEKIFRWRAGEITRLEGFSDAVFAFAVTLLVVSLEVPKSFHELLSAMSGFLAFAVCFAMLASIWYEHHIFFRRYGFQNVAIHTLNLMLLFVVLLYVYPLKFLFTLLVGQLMRLNPETLPTIAENESRTLMTIYGLGFAAVFLVFGLLYRYAWKHREELELNKAECLLTRERIFAHFANVVIGAGSALLANFLPQHSAGLAGFLYILIGPVRAYSGAHYGKPARLAMESMPRQSSPVHMETSGASKTHKGHRK